MRMAVYEDIRLYFYPHRPVCLKEDIASVIKGTWRHTFWIHWIEKILEICKKLVQNYLQRNIWQAPLAEMLSTAIQFSHTGFINKKDSFGYGDFDSKLGFSVQEIPQVWSQLFVYKIPFDLWFRNHSWHRKNMLTKT